MPPIKKFMKDYGISFNYLVEETGYSLGYLNRIVNGHLKPSPRVKLSIMEACQKYIEKSNREDPMENLKNIL